MRKNLHCEHKDTRETKNGKRRPLSSAPQSLESPLVSFPHSATHTKPVTHHQSKKSLVGTGSLSRHGPRGHPNPLTLSVP